MITAQALQSMSGVRHGFLTRRGGVSGGCYDSLNCGFGSKDDGDHVAANRQRALARLGTGGTGGNALVTAYQVHSAKALAVTAPWQPGDAPEADALVTNRPGIALGILSADCAPVLFADGDAGVIGAAHAGWRGARDGVIEATVEAMVALGARTARIAAAIGPCIHQDSYEVGPEFQASFIEDDPANQEFFRTAERLGHFHFDLPGYLLRRLDRLALGAIEALPLDTYGDEDRFFSYRRTTHRGEDDFGRGISMVVL